jgi:hypothetical protein
VSPSVRAASLPQASVCPKRLGLRENARGSALANATGEQQATVHIEPTELQLGAT